MFPIFIQETRQGGFFIQIVSFRNDSYRPSCTNITKQIIIYQSIACSFCHQRTKGLFYNWSVCQYICCCCFFFFFFFFFFLPSKQLFEFHYNGLLTVKMKWIRPNEITLTSICINTPKLLKVWLLLKERIFSQGKRVFSFKNTLF